MGPWKRLTKALFIWLFLIIYLHINQLLTDESKVVILSVACFSVCFDGLFVCLLFFLISEYSAQTPRDLKR